MRACTAEQRHRATATTAPRINQGLKRRHDHRRRRGATGCVAERASSSASTFHRAKMNAAGSATDFNAAASESATPPAAATASATPRRRTLRASNNAANASVTQKMKWTSERNSAPYSMNGK